MSTEDRISALEVEMSSVKASIGLMGGQVTSLSQNQVQLIKDVQSNTDTCQAIKTNTEDLIDLLRGGRVFGKITAWVVGLGASVLGVWAAIKGLR